MFDEKHPFYGSYKFAKRIAIGIVGGTVLLIGIVMIVLPGPAFVVIPAGLAILGIEFAWARHWLKKVKAKAGDVTRAITGRNKVAPPPADPGNPPAAP